MINILKKHAFSKTVMRDVLREDMKKNIIGGSAVLVAILVVIGIVQPDRFDFACRLIGVSDTIYAPGFSRTKFARVKLGMSRERVESLLGQGFPDFNAPWDTSPALTDPHRRFYSASGDGGNHWRFWITFDKDDKVSRIQREFYWD